MPKEFVARCLAIFVACVGCSASRVEPAIDDAAPTDAPIADSERDVASGTESDAAGGPCGAPANDAPTVSVEINAARFPAATGGPIIAGRYHLTRVEVRGGATGTRKFMRTVNITPTTWAEVDRDPSTTTGDSHQGGSVTTNGTELTITYLCRGDEPDRWVYTAAGQELFVMDVPLPSGSPILRFTYTRQ